MWNKLILAFLAVTAIFFLLLQNLSFYENKESVLNDYKMQKAPENLRVVPLYLGRYFIKDDLRNMIIKANSLGERANFLYLLGVIGDDESRKIIEVILDTFKEDCDTALLCLKALISIDGKEKVKLKYKNYKLKCFFNQSYIDIFELIDRQIGNDKKYNVSYFDIISWWADWKTR